MQLNANSPRFLIGIVALAGLSFLYTLTASLPSKSGTLSSLSSIAPHSQLAQVADTTTGLVGWWKFDEGSGSVANDSSGGGHTSMFAGLPAPVWTTGKIGGALSFNGSSGYMSGTGDPAGNGNMTICVWANIVNGGSTQQRLATSHHGYSVGIYKPGNIWYFSRNGETSRLNSPVPAFGSWSLVCAASDSSGQTSMYTNGILTATGSAGAPSSDFGGFSMGADTGGGASFDGALDDVRIYNRVLTATDIQGLYSVGGGVPPTAPVISSVSATNITTSGATITWVTDQNSSSQVAYGLTSGYGSQTAVDTTQVTSHSMTLSNLAQNTTYHYAASSTDMAGSTHSADYTFTTTASAPLQPWTWTLTVNAGPNGTVVSNPAGINCGTTCQVTVNMGTTVTLTATPNPGYATSWTSCPTASGNTCTITVMGNSWVYVVFVPEPVVSSVNASSITQTGATITWTTDEPATSQVTYGQTTYASSTALDSAMVTSHSQTISNLLPGTSYTFGVHSTDGSGKTTDSLYHTFSTLGTISGAHTYTVKKDGTGDFTTIQACANVATAGQTCAVYAGSYDERVVIPHSGTNGSPIVFQGVNSPSVRAFNITNQSYITIENFAITHQGMTEEPYNYSTANSSIVLSATSHIEILNNNFHDTESGCIFSTDPGTNQGTQSNYVHIMGNTIIRCGAQYNNGYTSVGLNVYGDHNLVENNDISHLGGDFMHATGGVFNIFRNNNLHDNSQADGPAGDIDHIDGLQNWCSSGNLPTHWLLMENNRDVNGPSPDEHFSIFQDQGNCGEGDIVLRFNTVSNMGDGFIVNNEQVSGVRIYNNTIVNPAVADAPTYDGAIYFGDYYHTGVGATNGRSINNIMYEQLFNYYGNDNEADAASLPGFFADYNLGYNTTCGATCVWSNNIPGIAHEPHSLVNHDPLFTNMTGNDFSLQSASPAIQAGGPLTHVSTTDSGSGTTLTLDDAGLFQDGYGDPASWNVQPDWIAVGSPTNVVQISSINYSNNTVTLASPITRHSGDSVWLYKDSSGRQVLFGNAPDMGASPHSGTSTSTTTPPNPNPTPAPNPISTDTTPPSAPTGLTAFGVTANQVNLTWSASTDNVQVYGYDIYRNGGTTPIATVTGTGYSDTNLTSNTSYSYAVKARDTSNNSSQAAMISTSTLPATYSITVTSSGTGSGTITCGGSACPTTVNQGPSVTFTEAPNTGSTFSSWSGICAGTAGNTCTVVVNANITVSASFTAITNQAPTVTLTSPGANSSFKLGSAITLSATASDPNAGGSITKVEFYASSTLVATDTVAPYSNSWTPTIAGTYTIVAKAYGSEGMTNTTNPISISVVARLNKPPKVGNPHATAGSVILSWDTVTYPYATHVAIYRSTTSFPDNSGTPIATVSTNSYEDKAVNPGTTYYYALYTVDDQNNYSDPTDISFTTPSPASYGGNGGFSGGGGGGGGGATQITPTKTPCVFPIPSSALNITIGTRGTAVTSLQTFLAIKGFLQQKYITGYYGALTQTALNSYLKQHPLPPSCVSATNNQDTRNNNQTNSNIQSSNFTRTLTLGAVGEDVRQLQIFLNGHGFAVASSGNGSKGHESTYFGPATMSAVAAFQRAYGITPTYGNFGLLTRTKVNGMLK